MPRILSRLLDALPRLATLDRRLDEVKINQGLMLCEMHRHKRSDRLSDYEFKVFSQWGEDGILQHLIAHLPIAQPHLHRVRRRGLLRVELPLPADEGSLAGLRHRRFGGPYRAPALARTSTGSSRSTRKHRSSRARTSPRCSTRAASIARSASCRSTLTASTTTCSKRWAIGVRRSSSSNTTACSVIDAPVTVPYDAAFTRTRAHCVESVLGRQPAGVRPAAGARGYALRRRQQHGQQRLLRAARAAQRSRARGRHRGLRAGAGVSRRARRTRVG